MSEPRPVFTCLHRPGKHHPWRAAGTGATMGAAMADAERNGCRNGEWRFEEWKAGVSDNIVSPGGTLDETNPD